MPFIQSGKSKLHYRKFGSGPNVMLAFHGFGQDNTYYGPVAEALQETFTIYSFDLFYHGQSVLAKANAPLTKAFFTALIKSFLQQESCRRFSVMGFSMGGKFALALLEAFHASIDTLYLIAPDGIKTSFWYNIATYPGWLSGMFKQTVVRPKPFFTLVHTLNKFKVIDPGLGRFARFQMGRPAKRLKIYRTWTGFRLLHFELNNLIRVINQEQIPVKVFFGSFDKVISAAGFKSFIKPLKQVKTVQLKTGHTHLLQEVGAYLKQHPDF